MSKDYRITTILGSILVYFVLVAFCLSQSVRSGVADDPNWKEGKDGAFMGRWRSGPVDVEPRDLNQSQLFLSGVG
jgi:hypothetical protein